MALPSSGTITTDQILAELGRSGPLNIPDDADVRQLTGIASGAIVLPNDFWGKSLQLYEGSITNVQIDQYSAGYNYGARGSANPDNINGVIIQRVYFEWFNGAMEFEMAGKVKIDGRSSIEIQVNGTGFHTFTWNSSGYYENSTLGITPGGTDTFVIK